MSVMCQKILTWTVHSRLVQSKVYNLCSQTSCLQLVYTYISHHFFRLKLTRLYDEKKNLPLYAMKQVVDCCYYKCPHTLQTWGWDMASNSYRWKDSTKIIFWTLYLIQNLRRTLKGLNIKLHPIKRCRIRVDRWTRQGRIQNTATYTKVSILHWWDYPAKIRKTGAKNEHQYSAIH
jgi:hypothetical protein